MIRFQSIKRFLCNLYQRTTRGCCDDETWSLDYSIAKLILPRLIRFKELNNGHPISMTRSEWDNKLDRMIATFEFLGSEERWERFEQKKRDEVQDGLNDFAKYYLDLWW
jgi:hypothetical protein